MPNTYKLYASRNLQAPSGIEFCLIPCCSNGKYILIYTDKQLDNSYKEINPNTKLESEEKTWVAECKAELVRRKLETNVRAMKENEKEYATMLNKFCDTLAKELKVEREKKVARNDNSRKDTRNNRGTKIGNLRLPNFSLFKPKKWQKAYSKKLL